MLDACEDERKDRVESSIQLQIDKKEMKQICLFHRRWGGWIVALLLSGGAMAQEASDTITDRIHQIDRVTVTARRVPNKLTSAAPVQSLSGQDIERLGIQDMADAVRRFAGAQVRDYGGIGGLKTVSVRNMGAAHTAVSYDGVTVSNCQAGQIDIGRFSLDNVSMVTLAVGQTDDLLQTARHYASAGVLSIETEKPHLMKAAAMPCAPVSVEDLSDTLHRPCAGGSNWATVHVWLLTAVSCGPTVTILLHW